MQISRIHFFFSSYITDKIRTSDKRADIPLQCLCSLQWRCRNARVSVCTLLSSIILPTNEKMKPVNGDIIKSKSSKIRKILDCTSPNCQTTVTLRPTTLFVTQYCCSLMVSGSLEAQQHTDQFGYQLVHEGSAFGLISQS